MLTLQLVDILLTPDIDLLLLRDVEPVPEQHTIRLLGHLLDEAHARIGFHREVLATHRILRTETVLHGCHVQRSSVTVTPKSENERRKLIRLTHDCASGG